MDLKQTLEQAIDNGESLAIIEQITEDLGQLQAKSLLGMALSKQTLKNFLSFEQQEKWAQIKANRPERRGERRVADGRYERVQTVNAEHQGQ